MPKTAGLAFLAAAAAALAVALPALAARDASASVTVTMSEFKFVLSKKTVRKGAVAFRVTNKGQIAHDFRIGGKKTPLVQAGAARTLAVTFRRAGRYTYICTLPTHADAGMRGVLVVK